MVTRLWHASAPEHIEKLPRQDIETEGMGERGMEHKGGGNMEHVESLKGSASDVADKV